MTQAQSSDIAKAHVSHGVEPHDLETGRAFVFSLTSRARPPLARRPYRASGLVHGTVAVGALAPYRLSAGKGRNGSDNGRSLAGAPQ